MHRLDRPAAHPAQPWPVRAELVGSDQCSASRIVAHGYTPVLGLCRELVSIGINPATALHVYRGDLLCLVVRSIGDGAALEINGDGTGFRPLRQPDAAPPMRPNDRERSEERLAPPRKRVDREIVRLLRRGGRS